MNQIDLNNKNAVITGGAQGIGLAIAELFIDSGAQVSLWDRDQKLVHETASRLSFGIILLQNGKKLWILISMEYSTV